MRFPDVKDTEQKPTTERLEPVRAYSRGGSAAYDLELGKERHFESRFRRVVEEERVAISLYIAKELAEALDEECGPIVPGKKRVCRQFSRAYMVELFLYQRLINPRAKALPYYDRRKRKPKAA